MDKIYKSIADSNRRIILTMLKDKEMNVNQILANLSIGQATLSSHLAVLKKAGLVSCRVMGKNRIYKLETTAVDDLLKDIEKWSVKTVGLVADEIIIRRKIT